MRSFAWHKNPFFVHKKYCRFFSELFFFLYNFYYDETLSDMYRQFIKNILSWNYLKTIYTNWFMHKVALNVKTTKDMNKFIQFLLEDAWPRVLDAVDVPHLKKIILFVEKNKPESK